MAELRVLVCDDDPGVLELMLRRLDKMGFKPDRAGDGGVAQALIKENLYDLIVTDIYMPEATGLELLEMAKQRDPHVQVVIVTASATLDNAIDALNHGAFAYLSKPFDHLSVFDSTVSRALEFRQLIMANKRMADAQKMRGDMLEDEVAKRVGQLREKQQGLIDLLNCLPDGIVVVEEGGKLMMTSPAAEQWLARDKRSDSQPIAEFLGQVHSEWAEDSAYAELGEDKLRLLSIDYPHPNGKKRKAVLIRRSEDDEPSGPGTLAIESVAAIKEGLAWLFRQELSGPIQELVKQLASHINMLEQMTGAGDGARGGTSPGLAPAVLPEYLRHEPALDEPGAKWEDTVVEATDHNGKSAPKSAAPEPATRPTDSKATATKDEPPVEQTPSEPEASAEAAAEAEAEPLPEGEVEAQVEVEREAEAEAQAETEVELAAPAEAETEMEAAAEAEAETEAEAAAEAEAETEAEAAAEAEPQGERQAEAEPEPPTQAEAEVEAEAGTAVQEAPPEEPVEPQPDLASAPTKVLSEEEVEAAQAAAYQSQAGGEADGREEAEQPTQAVAAQDTGRIPLWQRVSKKRGTTPVPAEASKSAVAAKGQARIQAEAKEELEPDQSDDEGKQLPEAAVVVAEEQPAEKPAPKPKRTQEAPKASAKPAPPKAQASPRPSRSKQAEVREPELAGVGAEASPGKGKKKPWPPQLPSQDPDFDPELDISG